MTYRDTVIVLPGNPTKTCTRCGQDKPLWDFAPRASHRGKRWPWCRPCKAEYVRERRASGVDREDYAARYLRHPDEQKARATVARAIRLGKLVRPERCEACRTECRPDAHHGSYEREHWLDVKWLCRVCHHRHNGEWRKSEAA